MTRPEYNGAWPKIRLAILERDRRLCQIREPGCLVTATEVDHIIEAADGGSSDPHNLRSVCKPCHNGRKRGKKIKQTLQRYAQPSREW